MKYDAIKVELLEWVANLKDGETLQYLKELKDSKQLHNDWAEQLTVKQLKSIKRGLQQVNNKEIVPHNLVAQKHGL